MNQSSGAAVAAGLVVIAAGEGFITCYYVILGVYVDTLNLGNCELLILATISSIM